MTSGLPETHPLHRLFRGLAENTFLTELGIGDPKLVGYVADLLARFVPASAIWRIRNSDGERLSEIASMIAEAEASNDEVRRRDCHQHVGDFTLFWTGVYPEALGKLKASTSVDGMIDFQQQGKRSYYLASTMDGEKSDVLRRLSVEFDLCAFGLSRVRHEWEHIDQDRSGGRLIVA
jgi:hypothetical protein